MAASSLLDVCRFNPTLGGTTDWIVSTAATGYQTPAGANAVNSAQYSYRAESADLSQWEVGIGTYTVSTTTLTRTTVLFNSSGTTSKISFSTVPTVAIVALKEDLNQPPTRASLTITSALNPSGFANTTGLMLGMGGTCKLTPTSSGSVNVTFFGLMSANGGQSNNLTIRYGTGTAPGNAAILQGTIANSETGAAGPGSTSITDLFCTTASIAGLTVNTAYWFDLSMRTSGATSQSIALVGFSGHEI